MASKNYFIYRFNRGKWKKFGNTKSISNHLPIRQIFRGIRRSELTRLKLNQIKQLSYSKIHYQGQGRIHKMNEFSQKEIGGKTEMI